MKIREFIEKLSQFPPEADVTITDGMECSCYHTDTIEFQLLNYKDYYHNKKDSKEQFVDIGIGGNIIKD